MAIKTDKCAECKAEFPISKLRYRVTVTGEWIYLCIDCRSRAKAVEK